MADVESITLHASGLTFSALQAGPSNGSVVVCIHGFPDSPTTFRHQMGPLADAGYRVIAPTLRGYEPSSQPNDGDYSLITLADDVIGWLDDLGVEQAHLVGHDWGAAMVYTAAARHADRVITATTLAIPPLTRIPAAVRQLPRQLARSWYMTFFQIRGLSDRALAAGDWRLLRRLWRVWSPGDTLTTDEWSELRNVFATPGVVAGSLGYYRHNATPAILAGIRSTPAMDLTEVPVPTLIVHGADDGCIDRRLFEPAIKTEDFPAGVKRLEIADAGHFVHLEKPDQVNAAIVEHLSAL